MNFPQAIASAFGHYFDMAGRAPRSEYWYFTLFMFVVGLTMDVLDFALWPGNRWGLLGTIFGLATLLPSVSVSVRRLHDVGRTGWWLLIAFTVIGIIPLLVWAVQKGDDGDNDYGADPLAHLQTA